MSNASSFEFQVDPLAQELGVTHEQIHATIALLDDSNSVPFITRFRRDHTGGLDESQVREIQLRVEKQRVLLARKEQILKSVQLSESCTEKIVLAIQQAETSKQLEDLYLPFRPKKQSLAFGARERGLTGLAEQIIEGAGGNLVELAARFSGPNLSVDDALSDAGHIVTEMIAEDTRLRASLRELSLTTADIVCSNAQDRSSVTDKNSSPVRSKSDGGLGNDARKKQKKGESAFSGYFDFRERISQLPPHRVLAINRGEKERILRVRVEFDMDSALQLAIKTLIPIEHPSSEFIKSCCQAAVQRFIHPSLERELRRDMTDRAEAHAVEVFGQNLRHLLLQRPVKGHSILAIDPGFKTGCKLAALDGRGNVLEHAKVHLVGHKDRVQRGRRSIIDLVTRHNLSLIAIGNGNASRETELLVSDILAEELEETECAYVIANASGASVYSTSAIGAEELPDLDPTIRSAVSIGRRILDPLSELVKINPANIGVGMYQHDLKAKNLKETLDAVVASCVNYVGVDLNTASPSLLRYVSGLNQLTARRIYEHREANGPFRNRLQLLDVVGFGEAAFIQAAGFLRIADGDQPLDATAVHPESFSLAESILKQCGLNSTDVIQTRNPTDTEAISRLAEVDLTEIEQQNKAGLLTLKAIVEALQQALRDPRDRFPQREMRREVLKLEDLRQGMKLSGTVLNVVDFGVFVDIGLVDSALIHVSRLERGFVSDPHAVAAVGDVIPVWVESVDKGRRRVSLSAVCPDNSQLSVRIEGSNSKVRGTKASRNARSGKNVHRTDSRNKQPPPPPISSKMVDGDEPMRSFSDLQQFFQARKDNTDDNANK